MERKYVKIKVIGRAMIFHPGASLGLDTRQQQDFQGRIEDLHNRESDPHHMNKREFKVTGSPIKFGKGAVLWVEQNSLPKDNGDVFEEIWMPKTYQEISAPIIPKPERVLPKNETNKSSRENMR